MTPLKYSTLATAVFLAACSGTATSPRTDLARGTETNNGAKQQWDVAYLSPWHVDVRGPAAEDRYLILCYAGTPYGLTQTDSTTGSPPAPAPAMTLTFKRTGHTLEGTAGPVRLRCFSQNLVTTEYTAGWDSTLAGGPISGRFANDSLIITHADWRIEGPVSPPGGQWYLHFFGPSAQGPYVLGLFCMPATAVCAPAVPPGQQDFDQPGGFIAMTRVD